MSPTYFTTLALLATSATAAPAVSLATRDLGRPTFPSTGVQITYADFAWTPTRNVSATQSFAAVEFTPLSSIIVPAPYWNITLSREVGRGTYIIQSTAAPGVCISGNGGPLKSVKCLSGEKTGADEWFITCDACGTNYGTSCTFQNAHEGQFVTIGLNAAEGLSDGAITLQDYTTNVTALDATTQEFYVQ